VNVVPAQPRIYHITHMDNLPNIIKEGRLWSDAVMIARGGPAVSIGMSPIKERRLRLPVKCHPPDCVGDYVPFFFCPRPVMLYVIHRGNHPELSYQGGQGSIVHLEADLYEAVRWADSQGRRWAFSLSNAGAAYTEFRNRLDQLDEVDWAAVAARDFRDPQVKEGKQAEFLVYGFFPWDLVRRIGVQSPSVIRDVLRAITGARHQPDVEIRRDWYF